MSVMELEIKDIPNAEKLKKELDKMDTSVVDEIKEIELSRHEEEAVRKLSEFLQRYGYSVEIVSDRNGFRIILAEKGDNRYLIWIRGAPVSRSGLELAEKYVKPYESITEKILVKLVRKADYVKVTGWTKIHK